MANENILPECRARVTKKTIFRDGKPWIPVFCGSCGADGGIVPEENMTFTFYLCNSCSGKYGEIAGTYFMPDEIFFMRVKNEQLEKYGRMLTEPELIETLKDESHILNKLAKDR